MAKAAPKPRGLENRCCARLWSAKGGGLCMQRPVKGRARCKWHGGYAGDFTSQGRNWRPWNLAGPAAVRARTALGLPHPKKNRDNLPPPPHGDLRAMKQQALADIDWFEETAKELGLMPAPGTALAPVHEFTMPELLGDVGRLAFLKLRELLLKDREIRDPKTGKIIAQMDTRTERLELDLALGAAKLFARVSESALRTQGNDRLAEILDAIHKGNAEDIFFSE